MWMGFMSFFYFGYADNKEDRLGRGVRVSHATDKEEQQLISFL